MPDKWAQYAEPAQDKWSQYADGGASQTGDLSLGKSEIKGDTLLGRLKRSALSILPAAGATAGGAIAGGSALFAGQPEVVPQATALGSGVGAMAGESARRLLSPGDTSDPIQGIANQGELGMASELGGQAIGKLAPIFRNSANRQMENVLAPAGSTNKLKAAEVAPELVKRRVIALTPAGMERKLADMTAQSGRAVGDVEDKIMADAATQFPQRDPLPASDIRASLQSYKNAMMVPGTGGRIAANDAGASAIDSQIQKLDELVQNQGGNLSPQSVIGLRRSLDKQVVQAKSGAYVGADPAIGSMTDAKQEFANALRRVLNDPNPDLAKVNAEYSIGKTALDVMHDTNVRKIGQEGTGPALLRFLRAGAIGGAFGFATHSPGEGIVLGIAMDTLGKAMRTTAWNTASASAKGAIADALASGNLPKVITLATQIAGKPSTDFTGYTNEARQANLAP